MKKIRTKVLAGLLCIVVALGIVLPLAVLGQTPVDITGFYIARAPTTVYDTNGVKYTYDYPYFGMLIGQTDEVVSGYLYGFNASSVSGSKARGGTATYNATMDDNSEKLDWGTNNLTVTATGTLGVYLRSGCLGSATNSTGNITGAPIDLYPGWNSLNVTTAGNITVSTWMDYTYLGEIAGTVGSSRVVLVGPDLVTWLAAGNSTITGVNNLKSDNETRVIAPGDIFQVTGNGTATITVPIGSSGNATGSGLTVNGVASVNLTGGSLTNLVLVIAGASGNLTVNIQTDRAFQISAMVSTNTKTDLSSLRGRFEGFMVLDNDPWNAKVLSRSFSAKEYSYTALLG